MPTKTVYLPFPESAPENNRTAFESFDPVVGWLVCTKGVNRGRAYQLHAGYNSIGRDPGHHVYIQNEETISSQEVARILYDRGSRNFTLENGRGREPVQHRKKKQSNAGDVVVKEERPWEPVLQHKRLERLDELLIGQAEFFLVPLCEPQIFTW